MFFAGYGHVTRQDGTSRSDSPGLRRLEVLRSAHSHFFLHAIPSASRQSGNSVPVLLIPPPKNSSSARQLKPRGTRQNPGVAPQNPVFGAKKTGFALKKAPKKTFALARETYIIIHRAQKEFNPHPPPRGMKPGKFPLCVARLGSWLN